MSNHGTKPLVLHRYHTPYWRAVLKWAAAFLGLMVFLYIMNLVISSQRNVKPAFDFSWPTLTAGAITVGSMAVCLAIFARDRYTITEAYIRRKSSFGNFTIHFHSIETYRELSGGYVRILTSLRQRDVYIHPVGWPDVRARMIDALVAHQTPM